MKKRQFRWVLSGLLSLLGSAAFAPSLLATDYFLNDNSTTNDVYTTAVGNNANNGTSPATPKKDFSSLLSSVALTPGDRVFIDTGSYSDTWTVTDSDDGASGNPLEIIGSTLPDGTVFTSNGALTYAFRLQGSSGGNPTQFVTLRNLTFDGDDATGFTAACLGLGFANNIIIENCIFRDGIRADTPPPQASFRAVAL